MYCMLLITTGGLKVEGAGPGILISESPAQLSWVARDDEIRESTLWEEIYNLPREEAK